MLAPAIAAAAVAALLVVHLAADARSAAVARAAGKVGASLAFVTVALLSGVHGRLGAGILAGLVLSVAGDALLLSHRKGPFLAGLVAFLLAHVAYAAAFAGVSRPGVPAALLVLATTAAALAWLWRGLGAMRGAVVAYCAVISVMLWLALGVDRTLIRAGALLFYASDLTVARDRFVAPGLANRLVGLPLYYGAQVMLALAAA
jgi:uncharacterized membrane protein YhhN